MSDLKVAENVVASVHYTGTLPDTGEVFDTSEGRDPLTFLVGHRQMIPGFEEELMGQPKANAGNSLLSQSVLTAPATRMLSLKFPVRILLSWRRWVGHRLKRA